MKRFYPFFFIPLLLIVFILTTAAQFRSAYAQEAPTPTSTYDPLAEPFVPENPSEHDLGHNWYWHNCMTCHGDVGQGLTDEFRAIWPEDHQNCWEHGCHGGRVDDEGFPIPTIVPALVREGKLAQFSSLQAFEEFLKATHPPQDPGGLEGEQYHAIALYVFSMNNRPLEKPTSVPANPISPSPTRTPEPEPLSFEATSAQSNVFLYIGLGAILTVILILAIRKKLPIS